jgi:hypothetical protein
MSISSVTATAQAVLPAAAARAPAESSSTRAIASVSLVQVDAMTQQPKPPRYPWLSRLARELETASQQPSPYGSSPVLGETLNQRA